MVIAWTLISITATSTKWSIPAESSFTTIFVYVSIHTIQITHRIYRFIKLGVNQTCHCQHRQTGLTILVHFLWKRDEAGGGRTVACKATPGWFEADSLLNNAVELCYNGRHVTDRGGVFRAFFKNLFLMYRWICNIKNCIILKCIAWHLSPSQLRTSYISSISLWVCMCIRPVVARQRLTKVCPSF
jgi:hypothetical protein